MQGVRNQIAKFGKIINAIETSDGAGVRLKRSLGTNALPILDPFLMLDEFGSEEGADYIAGFPNHPHRGFETVTYMLNGKMQHKDNKGNEGVIETGGVQWMTAGKGVIHSEMPLQKEGLMRGFQLWINLPSSKKMCEPRYQDIRPEDVPEIKYNNGNFIKVISGSIKDDNDNNVFGCVKDIITNPIFLDVHLKKGNNFSYSIPSNYVGFIYTYEGSISMQGTILHSHQLGTLEGHQIEISSSSEDSKFILLSAIPINEPVARRGPFVMNTQDELMQAYLDFSSGLF